MRVIILTTSAFGTTGHHLPVLYKCKDIEIVHVVVSEGHVANPKNQLKKRLKKILKIGLLGSWNGIKMRKWYKEDIGKYCKVGDAEAFCKEHSIPFSKVPTTNCFETQRIFKEANADVGLSLGNGFISSKVFTIPQFGMLNIHHELLPEYQNAQSIIWEIYNGSTDTGYTIHKINKQIDKGEILYQEKVPITFRDTLADTVAYNYAALFDASVVGLIKVLRNFKEYFASAHAQGQGTSYTTPSYWQFLKMERQFKKLKQR